MYCFLFSRLYDVLPKSQEERKQRLRAQAANNEFHRFVDNNLILHQAYLDKRKGLFARKRMFLLTEGPHLYYVDAGAGVRKGEVLWDRNSQPECKNFKIFFLHTVCTSILDIITPSLHYYSACSKCLFF